MSERQLEPIHITVTVVIPHGNYCDSDCQFFTRACHRDVPMCTLFEQDIPGQEDEWWKCRSCAEYLAAAHMTEIQRLQIMRESYADK